MFKNIRCWFWQRKVRSVLRRNKTSRKTLGLADAQRIGVYHAYRNKQEMESLRLFVASLVKAGKQVKVLVYVPPKMVFQSSTGNGSVSYFSKRDVDWMYFPYREANDGLEDFIASDYDLLLDFSKDFHYTDVAVMAMIVSHMKVGKFTPWNLKVNDLCLSPEATENYVASFIKTLEHYLPLFFDGKQAQKH